MNDGVCRVGMLGCGTVGSGVAGLLDEHAAMYQQRAGRPIELTRVMVRHVDAAIERSGLSRDLFVDSLDELLTEVDVLVEVAGGTGVALDAARRALAAGLPVVTANKAMLADHGPELFALARSNRTAIAFEASCAGGIPCATALMFGLMSNRLAGLYGILNGTCNFILSEMTDHGRAYDDVLADAQRLGYAEADPTLDVSGRDAAQKLAVLGSLAFGVQLSDGPMVVKGIDGLSLDDVRFGAELGYDVKLLGIAERGEDGRVGASVQPCFVKAGSSLAEVHGVTNAVAVRGDAVGSVVMTGPGAGKMPTASAVVSDLLNVAAGWYVNAMAAMPLTADAHAPAELVPAAEETARYYLRMHAMDQAGVVARVADALGRRGVSIMSMLQHEVAAGAFVPVVVTTHEAQRGELDAAIAEIESMDAIDGAVVAMRIVDVN
ncbi:MAG: homoserine dehydrogenase [Planctomycetota bacterium]